MKTGKTLAASILSLISSVVGGIFSGYMALVLWVVVSLSKDLNGEVTLEGYVSFAASLILTILSVVALILSIIVLVKRNKGLYSKKALPIIFIVVNAVMLVLYLVMLIMSLNVVYIIAAVLYLLITILLILDLVSNKKALKKEQELANEEIKEETQEIQE